jgi:dihydroorotate dehydrogenase subfamily 1
MAYKTELMGLTLKNPIMTASGPWAGNAVGIQRCIDEGAAAVITETISLEARERISPRLFTRENRLFNTMLYSYMHLEEWEDEFRKIDRKDAKIICSIWGATPSEIAYLARKVEHMGADAIELSISAPIGSRNRFLSQVSDIYEYALACVRAVSIPVMVKLSYEASCSPWFLRELEQAGVQAVSAIDALKGLAGIDLETGKTLMPTYGGYTGSHIHPVSLATTATLHQYTPLPVVSSGGVTGHEAVLEFLMLGATAVQLASAILFSGYEVISDTIESLERWMQEHYYTDIAAIRGNALPSLHAYEDIVPGDLYASAMEECQRADCAVCVMSCLLQAISYDESGSIAIDRALCDGCGLCVARCPHHLLTLEWS